MYKLHSMFLSVDFRRCTICRCSVPCCYCCCCCWLYRRQQVRNPKCAWSIYRTSTWNKWMLYVCVPVYVDRTSTCTHSPTTYNIFRFTQLASHSISLHRATSSLWVYSWLFWMFKANTHNYYSVRLVVRGSTYMCVKNTHDKKLYTIQMNLNGIPTGRNDVDDEAGAKLKDSHWYEKVNK